MVGVFVLVGSCDADQTDGEGEDSAAGCEPSDEPARLLVQNRTGNTIEVINMRACDGSELVEFPVPSPGLATGEDLTLDLPAPGCWILTYTGEGCFTDPPAQTPTEGVCAGDSYTWTATDQTHGCMGAGW